MTATAEKSVKLEKVLRPLGDRIVIRPISQEAKTAGGIIIPDSAIEKRKEGIVVAVGPGRWNAQHYKRDPMDVNVGETVLFGKWSGTDVELKGKELMICHADDILSVVDEVSAGSFDQTKGATA